MPQDLPTVKAFKKATSVVGKRKGIAAIDVMLGEWHDGAHPRSLAATIGVYKACRQWMKLKAEKTSSGANKRKQVIDDLIPLTMQWVAHLDPTLFATLQRFNANKAQGVRPGLKSMSGVYAHERTLYLSSNKTRAPSATRIDGRYDPALIGVDENKSFNDLTEQEFAALDVALGQRFEVTYLKKLERLRQMVLIDNGRLLTYDGHPITTGNVANDEAWPYAIDKYGNLFLANDRAHMDASGNQFNHSSFNAGHDVVCAGTIRIDNGRLLMINNNSGHYKPSREHLFNGVRLLSEELGREGTMGAKVEFWNYVENPGHVRIYEFNLRAFPKAGMFGSRLLIEMPVH